MLFVIITHFFDYNHLFIGYLCKLYSFLINSHTTTPLYYILKSIELHMIYSSTNLFWNLLLPPIYNINLHYSPICGNIHIIDETRAAVFGLIWCNRKNDLVTLKILLLKIQMNWTQIQFMSSRMLVIYDLLVNNYKINNKIQIWFSICIIYEWWKNYTTIFLL